MCERAPVIDGLDVELDDVAVILWGIEAP